MVSINGQSITLANSIIGVGILAMPFCFKECGIILAIIILIISGIISRFSCYFLLKSALLCRRRNFESLAFQIFGTTGKFLVEICIIGFLLGTCIAYFVVVGDLGPQIVAKLFNLNHSNSLRTFVMICVSMVCVLPLGLLRNVDSLSNFCAATICFYICLVFKVISEATSEISTSDWLNHVEYWRTDGVLQCMPIFSMALFCQTQLFEIYDSLPNASLDKMNTVAKNAINICTVVYVLVGFFGYIAFYAKPISGNILVSFSPSLYSDAIKIGFVMSLAFSFPLIIFPCRASLYSLLYRKGQSNYHDVMSNLIPETRFRWITIIIVAMSLAIGLLIPNIELVLGLIGSTIGVMISVIIPAACFICISNKYTNDRILAQIILFSGVIVMVLGTYANLQAVDNHKMQSEQQYVTSKVIKLVSEDKNAIIPDKIVFEQEKFVKNEDSFKNPLSNKDDKQANDNEMIKESKIQPPVPVEPIDNNKEDLEVIKESKIQPPVPVAPLESEDNKNKKEDFDLKNKKNLVDKDKDEHDTGNIQLNEKPKDEISQLEESPNMINDEKLAMREDALHDNIKMDEKNLIEKAKELQSISDVVKNDEAIENLKKEALIEQIKKHGKEQRELVEEQKEILKEIKKTQLEIEEEKLKADKSKIIPDKEDDNQKKELLTNDLVDINAQDDREKSIVDSNEIAESNNNHKESNNLSVNENNLPESDKLNINRDDKDHEDENKHVHKNDEPKSYRLGEDQSQVIANNVDTIKSNKEAMVNNVPIPIALQRNNYSRVNINNIGNKDDKKLDSINMVKDNSDGTNHLGAQRDILKYENSEEVNHKLNKRSIDHKQTNDSDEKVCDGGKRTEDSDRNMFINDVDIKKEFSSGVLENTNLGAVGLSNMIISRNLKSFEEDADTG